MTKLECGCRIMSDVIDLNADDRDKPAWSYMMKTYSNMCGRHSHRQLKFHYMENKLLEMEKARMRMFMEENDDDDDDDDDDKNQKRTNKPSLDGVSLATFRKRVKVVPVSENSSSESEEEEDEEKDDETTEEEIEEEETPYEELKAYLKEMSQEDRKKYRQFETLRNLANGLSPNYKMDDINKAIKELEREEREEREQEQWENSSLFNHMVSVAIENSD